MKINGTKRTKFAANRILIALIAAIMLGSSADPAATEETASPAQAVRTAVAHEVAAANNSSPRHMFRSRKQTPQGSQTRLYVETRDAMAGMTIAYNDKPLTPEQLRGEEDRLRDLVTNPEQLKRKHSQEQENADRTLRILKALPDAFLYEYDGYENEDTAAKIGKPGNRLLRLKFSPNPAYRPPSRVEEVLTGMQGTLLLDSKAQRIARMDGTLGKEVGFGWGILGHLDKGGHFLVEQLEVEDGSWQISRMALDLTGKLLLFKSISFKSEEVLSDFRRVPEDITFAKGVEMLEAEQAKLSQTNGAELDSGGRMR